MQKARATLAGELMGRAIVEMVHLMYQADTALKFLSGLQSAISKEVARRHQKYPKLRKRRRPPWGLPE